MRSQDDINTVHNIKSICREAMAQWTTCLTRNGLAGSKLEMRKYSFITKALARNHLA